MLPDDNRRYLNMWTQGYNAYWEGATFDDYWRSPKPWGDGYMEARASDNLLWEGVPDEEQTEDTTMEEFLEDR